LRTPSQKQVQDYLQSISPKKKIAISYFGPLDSYEKHETRNIEIKKLGYGTPLLIVYREISGKQKSKDKKAILSTMRVGNGFGHDYRADRVDNLVLSFDTWNSLPQHVRVKDLGAFRKNDSSMISLADSDEFFLLRQMVKGSEYYKDLDRIFETGKLESHDLEKATAMAEYLVKIHRVKYSGTGRREIYERKIRDTVGHGECIFGLSDSYPRDTLSYLHEDELLEIEKKCVEQRWKLKENDSRLSQVHGDFHPWNILFDKNPKFPSRFVLLDRSRGQWGEPADDVCALSINYLFYSLRKYGALTGEFLDLFDQFMQTYADGSKDSGLSVAMPLFYVFRALVIASPLWYPDLSNETRRRIFDFAQHLLDEGRFDYSRIGDYFRSS
jgi:hypothetical protein